MLGGYYMLGSLDIYKGVGKVLFACVHGRGRLWDAVVYVGGWRRWTGRIGVGGSAE